MRLEDIKWNEKPRRSRYVKCSYDIKITMVKSGKNRGGRVRIAYHNKAKELFMPYKYIAISDVESMQDRIYFKPYETKESTSARKITFRKPNNISTEFTLTGKAEKIIRTKWQNGVFCIQYDPECDLFFIERSTDEH